MRSGTYLRNGSIEVLNPLHQENMNFKSLTQIDRSICLSALAMATVATGIQSERAAAIGLSFNTPVAIPGDPLNSTTAALGGGSAYTNLSIGYADVATGLDAKITATPFTTSTTGSNYTFRQHLTGYTSAGNSSGDAGFVYDGNTLGSVGGMTYKIELFQSGSNFTVAAAPQDLSFLIYDVDGETTSPQTESLRIFKGDGTSGFTSYRLGSTSTSLKVQAEDGVSYVFGKQTASNVAETNVSGDIILNFTNTNSVLFQFEATTISGTTPNPVFSAIDGDFTILPNTNTGVVGGPTGSAAFGSVITANAATAVPEPFTIIGTIIGGTAAVRMRKKLKANRAD